MLGVGQRIWRLSSITKEFWKVTELFYIMIVTVSTLPYAFTKTRRAVHQEE